LSLRKLISAIVVLVALQGTSVAGALAAPARDTSVSGSAIVQTALRYLGYAYTTVGNSPATGFSCIGFVSYVYGANGIPLPDDLGGAMGYAAPIAFSDLQPGDVLYFGNTVWPGLSHTAIYLGGGRFIHAEWYNRGVVISSFTNDPVDFNYWTQHYIGANRPWGVIPTAPAPPAAPQASPAPNGTTSVSSAPVAPRPSLPPLLAGPRASIEVAGLNIRVRPSLLGPVRRVAAEGTNVVVLKQYLNWDWVQLPDRSFGWVMGTGIGGGGETSSTGALASQAQPLSTIRAGGLRVHLRPNVGAPVVTMAYRGQHVLVVEGWNSWLRVIMPHGQRGWVSGAYVDLRGSESVAGTHVASTPAVRRYIRKGRVSRTRRAVSARASYGGARITASVRLRVRPGLHAGAMGLAASGSRLTVLGSWNGWVYARFRNGRSGWVYGAYVRQ
jgi:SH3-like domain-containing protein